MKLYPFARRATVPLAAAFLTVAVVGCSSQPTGGTTAATDGRAVARTGEAGIGAGVGPGSFGTGGSFGGVSRPGTTSVAPGVGPTAGGGFGAGVGLTGIGGGFGAGGNR